MYFQQVLHRDLGCASYVLGDAAEAVIVDPRWDVDVYLEIAAAERLRIVAALDTHEHADHVSGAGRLAQATAATRRRPVGDGDVIAAWPGHVGGSLCEGSGLSHKTSSTIGFERRYNPPLALERDAFVDAVTSSLPCRPPNVERIVERLVRGLRRDAADAVRTRSSRGRDRRPRDRRSR